MKPPARAAALLLAALSACWTAALRTIPETRSPYDRLPTAALERLAEARAVLESGEIAAARSELSKLAEEYPQNIPIAIGLQDVEIANPEPTGAEGLRERYRKRAEEEPTAANLVLAARVEPDAEAARVLLERAGKLDPACPWSAYGRAWLAANAGDWGEVRLRIAEAKLADPGHMPTLWLETWMLARGGGLPEAITSLNTWIEHAREDPRIDPRLVREAELDRALLAVLDRDPKLALKLLAELEGTSVDPARRLMVEAAALQEQGDGNAALAAAQQAERLAPDDLLPVVEQALLHEIWLGDARAAETDWNRVLEISRSDTGHPSLGALLERVRARVRLERFAAARTQPEPREP